MFNSFVPGRSDRNNCKDIYTISSKDIISEYQKKIANFDFDIDAGGENAGRLLITLFDNQHWLVSVEYKFIGQQSVLSLRVNFERFNPVRICCNFAVIPTID